VTAEGTAPPGIHAVDESACVKGAERLANAAVHTDLCVDRLEDPQEEDFCDELILLKRDAVFTGEYYRLQK
jgi:hypothetical protein